MIQYGIYSVPKNHFIGRERAILDCGCTVLVGVRTDRDPPEASTVAIECSDEHRPIAVRFNDLMRWSILNGGEDRPLIDVVDEILQEASRE